MLIDSPRLSAEDRTRWETAWRADQASARSPKVDRLAETARAEIERFAAAHEGEAHVMVSWGRDSVTIAHLAHGLGLRLVYVTQGARPDRVANPDCPLVRDAYLTAWLAPYEELVIERPHAYRWLERQPGYTCRVTGLRADESVTRALSRSVHGVSTSRSCRPIISWRSGDVWAYLARHDLPIHPAYACSFGGMLSRDRIRVNSIGGDHRRGWEHGRRDWEDHYYPEARDSRSQGRLPGRGYQA